MEVKSAKFGLHFYLVAFDALSFRNCAMCVHIKIVHTAQKVQIIALCGLQIWYSWSNLLRELGIAISENSTHYW